MGFVNKELTRTAKSARHAIFFAPSAATRKAEAKGRSGSRAASLRATSADRLNPSAAAIAARASQNSASKATLVRCPASEKLRLINPLMRQASSQVIAVV